MDFTQKKKVNNNEDKYHYENLKITRDFSKGIIFEMKELVRSIVLFGSNTQDTLKKDSDIDIMIVLDNVSIFVSQELKEAYNIIISKLTAEYSNKLHILTMNLSDLWDMARKGDPVLINILRFGLPIFDRDLITPMQYLLETGKIKPTREAANNYISRSTRLLEESDNYLLNGVLDMYYSIVDIVHAVLITQNITPPSPKEMPAIFKKTFKKTELEKYSKTIDEFYKLGKNIEHKKITNIKGIEYEKYKKQTHELVKKLEIFAKKQINSKDNFDL